VDLTLLSIDEQKLLADAPHDAMRKPPVRIRANEEQF
jgi:hypothetical protein